jgi:hypothetical protein
VTAHSGVRRRPGATVSDPAARVRRPGTTPSSWTRAVPAARAPPRTILVRPSPPSPTVASRSRARARARLPWTVINALRAGAPTLVAADNGFPCAGANWCDFGAEGTSNASPPSNPLGSGTPPSARPGSSRTSCSRARPAPVLRGGLPAERRRDSTDAQRLHERGRHRRRDQLELYYADSSRRPLVSTRARPADERAHQRARRPARAVPAASASTVLSLRAGVGNAAAARSRRAASWTASASSPRPRPTFRNGHGSTRLLHGRRRRCSAALDARGRRDGRPGVRAALVTRARPALADPAAGWRGADRRPLLFTSLPSSGGRRPASSRCPATAR